MNFTAIFCRNTDAYQVNVVPLPSLLFVEAFNKFGVVKYEIYDLMNKQWMVIADGCNDFLIKPDDLPAGVEKHPYAFLNQETQQESLAQANHPIQRYHSFFTPIKNL